MEDIPRRSPDVSQWALKTTIPLGLYLDSKAGPKSLRNLASSPRGPWYFIISAGILPPVASSTGMANMGEPWPKKNAGIFSGVPGSSSRALRHSDWDLGKEVVSFDADIVIALDRGPNARGSKDLKRDRMRADSTERKMIRR